MFVVDSALAVMSNTECWCKASRLDCSQVVHIPGIVVDPSFELDNLDTWEEPGDLNRDGENNEFIF